MGVQYNTGAVSKLLEDEKKKKNSVTYNTSAVDRLLGNTNASNALTQETAYRQSVLDAAQAVANQQAQANARKPSNTSSPSTGALSTQTKLNTTTPVVYEGSTAVGKTLPTASKTTTKQQAGVSTIQALNPTQPVEPTTKIDNSYVAPTITLDEPVVVADTPVQQVAQQTTQQSNVQPTVYESKYTYDAEKPTYQAAEKQTSASYAAPTYQKSTYSATPVQAVTASFTPSQEYYDAMAETQRMLEQLKSGRTSYTDKISQSLKAIEDTSPFSYDFNSDPMFQQMLQGAMSSGKYAMQDTMGQAAALTGGYGSSYSQMVGQQAYNRYIDEAYDRIPDYWNMALSEYQTDLNNKYNKLNQYMNLDNTEWGRNYDTFNSQYQMANDQYNKEYNNFWQTQNFNENSRQWAESENDARARYAEAIRQYENDFNHNLYREAIADERYADETAYERYLNELNQYNIDRNFDYGTTQDAITNAMNQAKFDRAVYEDDRNYNYNASQDAITNALNEYKAKNSVALDWANQRLNSEKFNYQKDQDKEAKEAAASSINYEKFSDINTDAKYAAQNMTEAQYWAWADKQMQGKNYNPADFERVWDTYGKTKGDDSIVLDKNGFYYDTKNNKQVLLNGSLRQPYFYPTEDPNVYVDDYGNPHELEEIRRLDLLDRIIKG